MLKLVLAGLVLAPAHGLSAPVQDVPAEERDYTEPAKALMQQLTEVDPESQRSEEEDARLYASSAEWREETEKRLARFTAQMREDDARIAPREAFSRANGIATPYDPVVVEARRLVLAAVEARQTLKAFRLQNLHRLARLMQDIIRQDIAKKRKLDLP